MDKELVLLILITILVVLLIAAVLFAGPLIVNWWLAWTFGLAPIPYWKLFVGMMIFNVYFVAGSRASKS